MESAVSNRPLRAVALCLLLLAPAVAGSQEPEAAPPAGREDVEPFLGQWVLRVTSPQGEFDAELEMLLEGDEPRAALDLGPLGRQDIQEILREEEGLLLHFEANLGGMTMKMKMPMSLEGEELVGSVGDTGGFFTLDYRGITEVRAQELERAGERRRIRLRAGPQRTQRAELAFGDDEVAIRFDTVPTEDDSFTQIESLDDGVVQFLQHQSTKLFTDLDLRFGDVSVETENVAENYPGVYSLWLRRKAGEWYLLFNEKADVWGNQHDPNADRASVPLDFVSDADPPVERLRVELSEAENGGALQISWGPYRWSTSFTVDAR